MNRREFIRNISLGAASLSMAGCIGSGNFSFGKSKRSERPNIIFILTDDQAPWAFGASPNADVYSPNIDKLCSEGVRLTNCYVTTPVCSPSRASLLTSRYSTEVGITDFIKSPREGLDPSFAAWPRVLADAGYATGLIGKWHLGEVDEYHPMRFGYQEFTGFRWGAKTSKDPEIEIDGKVQRVEGYTPDILTDHAIDFISRNRTGPFMLSLHYWAPHCSTLGRTADGRHTWLPLSEADWKRFENLEITLPVPDYPQLDKPAAVRMMREYLASVASMDRNLGRLTQRLDELGLSDNTVVIFTSDNGYNVGHNGVEGKGNSEWVLLGNRSDRPNLYDNSLRVPAVIRWSGRIKPGTKMGHTITFLDWFPTIASIAGASERVDRTVRGRDFLPLLLGKEFVWDDDLYAQYTMRGAGVMRMYQSGRWKLVRDFKGVIRDELYDLEADPDEHVNLIDSVEPEIQNQKEILNEKLVRKMRQIDDPALSQIKKEN